MSENSIKNFSENKLGNINNKDEEIENLLCNEILPDLKQWSINNEPVIVGKSFVVMNSWQRNSIKDNPNYKERKPICIDPGTSIWDHESIQILIDLLETHWEGGSLLDVGTGTGILAIAAVIMYPDAKVDAFDASIDAMEHALQNVEINDFLDKINIQETTINTYLSNSYDLIIVNSALSEISITKSDLKCLKPSGKIFIVNFTDNADTNTLAQHLELEVLNEKQGSICTGLVMRKVN